MDFDSLQGQREFQNELALVGKMLAMASSPDYGWVVALLSYCSSDKKHRRQWWWQRREAHKEEVVEASTTGIRIGWRLLLEYELMDNGSLRDVFLDWRCPELMDWGCRFSVVLNIARSLQFLHTVCEPLFIHSDIKPSNILLDAYLSTKIADFGLTRLKTPIADDLQAAVVSLASSLGDDNEVAIEIVPNKAMTGDSKSFPNVKESAVGGGEDEASIMGEIVESTTVAARFEESIGCGGLAFNGGGLCARLLKHKKEKAKKKEKGVGGE
ncbi:putative receptor-like serine/threonine-protein kinase [Cocos nucifera]|nr:putative receptor-like serine/threonine-protein kinase [Cocos nucifera]